MNICRSYTNDKSDINKPYLYFYVSTLLIGAINLGYFTMYVIYVINLTVGLIFFAYSGAIVGNIFSGIFVCVPNKYNSL